MMSNNIVYSLSPEGFCLGMFEVIVMIFLLFQRELVNNIEKDTFNQDQNARSRLTETFQGLINSPFQLWHTSW